MTGFIAPTEQVIVQVSASTGTSIIDVGNRIIKDSEGNEYGDGIHTRRTVESKSLWTKKERSQMKDFLQLKRRGDYIKMIERYGTTDEKTLENRLNAEMLADPRLTVQTRRGEIHTTVAEQRKFSAQRASNGAKNKRRG